MSSSDVEILPTGRSTSFQRPPPAAASTASAYASTSAAGFAGAFAALSDDFDDITGVVDADFGAVGGSKSLQEGKSQVIELSDGSDDDDDDMQVLGCVPPVKLVVPPIRSATFPSSDPDDLPPPFSRRSVSLGIAGALAPPRVAPPLPQPRPPPAAAPAARRIPSKSHSLLDDSQGAPPEREPRLDTASSKAQGKRKAAQLPERDGSGSEDEYDKMARKGPQVVRKKRPVAGSASASASALLGLPDLNDDEFEAPPPKKKATKLSEDDKAAKKREQQAAKLAKEEAKKAEAASKAARIKVNNLKHKDKRSTVGELTVHISGTAFRSEDSAGETDSDPDGESLYETAAERKRRLKAKQKKASSWLNVAKGLQEKLAEVGCVVETPEMPRQDIGCEGAIRWTRWCDKKWDDGLREFVPLGEGNEIVVEEDTRLVFMTAHELSIHIANSTLSRHISTILSSIPAHVHLFLMHFGLKSLCREMVNAQQAAYREETRSNLDMAQPKAKSKKVVGIGAKQPDKETLEYELLKAQVTHRLKLIAVDKVDEAIDWLEQISYDVSQKPYQRHKQMHVALLGTSDDKIVSGKTLEETYMLMLASLRGVTEAAAKGIVREFPTIRDLYEAWEACGSERDRKEMLAGVAKGHLVSGARTDRAIGKAVSEFVYKVFTSRVSFVSLRRATMADLALSLAGDPEMFV